MFEIVDDAHTSVERWLSTEKFDYLKVSHDGYKRLAEPVIHHREFFFDKVEGLWLICDTFTGHGNHKFEWNWPTLLGLTIARQGRTLLLQNTRDDTLKIINLSEDEMDVSFHGGMISPSYGTLISGATFIRFVAKASVPAQFQFALIQNKANSAEIDRLNNARKAYANFEKSRRS
jgi:hypothetical protein